MKAHKISVARVRRFSALLLCLFVMAASLPAPVARATEPEKTVRVGWYEQCGVRCVLKSGAPEGRMDVPAGEAVVWLELVKGSVQLRGFRFE